MALHVPQAADFFRPAEDVSCLFSLAVLLPGQDPHAPPDHWLRRLYQAILADALKRLEGRSRDGDEALQWVLSDAESCFSFLTICAVLQFDAQAVRSAVSHRFAQGSARPGSRSRLPRHTTWRGRASGLSAPWG